MIVGGKGSLRMCTERRKYTGRKELSADEKKIEQRPFLGE
jgi:hypothetical protein